MEKGGFAIQRLPFSEIASFAILEKGLGDEDAFLSYR
jgi:hypothetical protein